MLTQCRVFRSLADLALAWGARLAPYFDWLSAPLLPLVFQPEREGSEDLVLLQCHALECLCALGTTVPIDRFVPFAQPILSLYTTLTIPPMSADAYAAFCRALSTLVVVGSSSMKPYAQSLILRMMDQFSKLSLMFLPFNYVVRGPTMHFFCSLGYYPLPEAVQAAYEAPLALVNLISVFLSTESSLLSHVKVRRRITEASEHLSSLFPIGPQLCQAVSKLVRAFTGSPLIRFPIIFELATNAVENEIQPLCCYEANAVVVESLYNYLRGIADLPAPKLKAPYETIIDGVTSHMLNVSRAREGPFVFFNGVHFSYLNRVTALSCYSHWSYYYNIL